MMDRSLHLKRVYEPVASSDGTRVLVERLWPRGLSREAAAIDFWAKDLAPSTELRRWFGHEPDKWPDFQSRYICELEQRTAEVSAFRTMVSEAVVTLVFAAQDEERNSAVVLKHFLECRTDDSAIKPRNGE